MVATVSSAAAAYANASKITGGGGLAAGGSGAGGDGFSDLLQQAAGDVVGALKTGEAQSLQAVTGKADLTAVTEAVNNAEVALQAVLAVRDKVISAYQDISKLSI
ncbi:MAG: flagellar hook-basal body complex protein FliE [Stellaceae bacterium]